MKRVIALADNCVDVYPSLGRFYLTGNAVDFAVNLRRQGGDVSLLTVFGDDLFGRCMEEFLQREGIDCRRCRRGRGATSFSQMELVSGVDRRHVAWEENVLAEFAVSREDLEYISGFDVVFTDAYTARPQQFLPCLDDGKRIFLHDFNQKTQGEDVNAILPHVTYAFFSRPADDQETRALLKEKQAVSGKTVIAMVGEHGSLAFDGRRFVAQPALPARVVNTVGAGDSFISGFAWGVCQGWELERCLQQGAAVAARVIACFDPYEPTDR